VHDASHSALCNGRLTGAWEFNARVRVPCCAIAQNSLYKSSFKELARGLIPSRKVNLSPKRGRLVVGWRSRNFASTCKCTRGFQVCVSTQGLARALSSGFARHAAGSTMAARYSIAATFGQSALGAVRAF
jgi:hypothetical protein